MKRKPSQMYIMIDAIRMHTQLNDRNNRERRKQFVVL